MYENVLLQILVQAAIQPTPTARLYGYADITRASRILPCSMQVRAFLAAEGQRGVDAADAVSGAVRFVEPILALLLMQSVTFLFISHSVSLTVADFLSSLIVTVYRGAAPFSS